MSVLLFVLSTLCFFIFLALWTYNDAKERTDNPKVWTLIVMAVPSFIGLIIYLLVGRDKDSYSSGRFQKAVITFAVCAGLSLVMLVGSAVGFAASDFNGMSMISGFEGSGFENLPIISGSLFAMESNLSNTWTRSFRTSNGERSRSVSLSADEIAAFHVNSTNTSGRILLRITQGSTEKLIDISDQYNSGVDLSDFRPGNFRLTLIAEQARNGNTIISWR